MGQRTVGKEERRETGQRTGDKEERRKTWDSGRETRNRDVRHGTEDGRQGTET